MPRHVVLAALLCLTLSPSTQALNSKGWYNSWETFINLFRPPAANRPVSAAEQQGDYPLLTNPPGFDDGFRPGLYGIWQEVRLAPETGALCGNGTPFKFYIRRAADNLNVNINLEPGGACWDYASCSGQAGIRGARNPNGIPDNYINKLDIALLTPFITPFTGSTISNSNAGIPSSSLTAQATFMRATGPWSMKTRPVRILP
ncbi:hypothetical protein AAIA72_00475 [Hahella sp. SMD15-11]|uniref:Uncharacterized protein n=1 Tax=Thermohahella caldifontis TaxID=3142973 RepID=A0AB39UXI6_9GAMM